MVNTYGKIVTELQKLQKPQKLQEQKVSQPNIGKNLDGSLESLLTLPENEQYKPLIGDINKALLIEGTEAPKILMEQYKSFVNLRAAIQHGFNSIEIEKRNQDLEDHIHAALYVHQLCLRAQ